MSRLPEIRILPAPEWQRRRLAEWLSEWRIDRILREVAEDRQPAPEKRRIEGSGHRAEERSPGIPDTGRIMLLRPDSAATCRRPVYVAVLARPDADSFIVAPYGRFSVPATPGELLTGRESAPLRVLCLWNAGHVKSGVLARSWHVDGMSRDELQDALTVLESVRSGELPEKLVPRIGPPLVHPADPRHDYEAEESGWGEAFRNDAPPLPRDAGITYLFPERDPSKLPRAAEPRDNYQDNSPSTNDAF